MSPDWMAEGICGSADQALFFPPVERTDAGKASMELAKAICRLCPVQRSCLDYALERFEPYGVFGGATAEERRKMRRRRRVA